DKSRTVHSEPEGVTEVLVDEFTRWMGGKDRHFWYNDTDLDADTERGHVLRQSIATFGADGVDFAAEHVPVKFAPVLDHMRRLPAAESADYRGLLDREFTMEEWRSYWTRRGGATKTPGLSGCTIAMVRSLPDDLQEDLLRIVNTGRRLRYVFQS
ncbi:MAG: hypothetical protein AAFY60_16400, partial [Myxococcota bacterium]